MKLPILLILLLAWPLSYAGPLLIGTATQNPPFASVADNKEHFYGFDIDIMGAICKRLKFNCQFKPIILNDLFDALATGKVDLAIAAIIINDQGPFIFSLPYMESNAQFLAKKQSTINKPADIANKKVGVRLGTPFKQLALTLYKNQITIVEFPQINDLLNALDNDTVDIVLINAAAAKYWQANNNDVYKLIGTNLPTGKGYGIMANPNAAMLIKEINQALVGMEGDGTYLQIYERYFDD